MCIANEAGPVRKKARRIKAVFLLLSPILSINFSNTNESTIKKPVNKTSK